MITIECKMQQSFIAQTHRLSCDREGFFLSVEEVRICFVVPLPSQAIGSKNSRHFLNQSEVKPKPIVTHSHKFSRALCRLHVFALSFDWFIGFLVSFVIDPSDLFWFSDPENRSSVRHALLSSVQPHTHPSKVHHTRSERRS